LIPIGTLWLVHWVVNPIIIIVLTRALFAKFRFISLPTVFIISYLLLIYVRALDIYVNDFRNITFLLSVWLVPYLFILFSGFGLYVFNNPRRVGVAFKAFRQSRRDKVIAKISPFLSIFSVLLLFVLILDKGIRSIALFFLILNPGAELETILLRIDGLTSNYSPILTVLYSYGRALFYPTYVAILIGLRATRLISRTHLFLVLGAAMLFSALDAEKAPLAYLMATAGFSFYLSNRGRINARLVLIWLVAMFLPAMIYPLLYGSQGIAFLAVAIEGLWRRVTWVPSFTSALYFDLFPRVFGHLGFKSNRILARIFGLEYVPVASMVYDYHYSGIQGGLVNTSFFASFYADWGMPGIVFGTILVALVIAGLQRIFDRYDIDAVSVGIRAVVLSSIVQLMLTNFYSVALGRGLLSLPILLVFLNGIFRVGRLKRRSVMAKSVGA
jgi:hypothetical protein